jgi:hypothetical protein
MQSGLCCSQPLAFMADTPMDMDIGKLEHQESKIISGAW